MSFAYRAPLDKNLYWLDPRVVFFNHGSFGATPRLILEKYHAWQRELERNPVEYLGRRFNALMRDARVALAPYVNADADDLIYVPNTTTGLNIVARSLRLNSGDEILTSDHEYGALDRTWRFLCKKSGAIYKPQPIPVPLTTTENFVETFWAGVTSRTRVIFLSHITSPTALIFPIQEICRRARKAGIITIIDGAHVIGQIPLDLEMIGADFYSSNLHKWLSCPKGSAFLHVRREMQPLVEPLIVSWGYESEMPGTSRFIDEQEWNGTRDYTAYFVTPDALKFYEEHDWNNVRAQCHLLAQYLRNEVHALTGLPPLSPDSTAWYMQMFSAQLPPCDPEKLKAQLYDDFEIEVPIIRWNNKIYIRVSVQAYNSLQEAEQLLNALKKLLNL